MGTPTLQSPAKAMSPYQNSSSPMKGATIDPYQSTPMKAGGYANNGGP